MQELLTVVEVVNPDVIVVTESWGNEDIADTEYGIAGYSVFRADRSNGHRGGGVLLLVRDNMGTVEVKMNSTFSDQIWCKIRITKGDDLLIGVCYCSSSIAFSDKENDDLLCDLLNEVRGKPLLLMGDFNYPDIDWHTSHGHSPASQKFVNSIEDAFMTQHVMEGTCNGAILDKITSETDMVDSVSVLNSLGNSNHNMLEWDVYLNPTGKPLFSRPSLDYARADFEAMRGTLRKTDWSCLLQGNADDSWRAFRGLLSNLEAQYVSVKKRGKYRKAQWMTYKAVKLVKRKLKVFRKYKNVCHLAYVKACREAAAEIRRSKRNFEMKLANDIDTDRKSFHAYVRSRSKACSAVTSVIDENGVTSVLPHDLAEEFNKYFTSVFTVEDASTVPIASNNFHDTNDTKLNNITFDEESIKKKLERLRPDKASGADDLSPRVLRELKDEIAYPITCIMKVG